MTPALITREGNGNTANMHKHVTTQHAVNLHKCKVFGFMQTVVTLKAKPMGTKGESIKNQINS